MAMVAVVENKAPGAPPLRAGDLWVAVSAKGKGQPVKVSRVTPLSVQFRAYGKGADESRTFSLPSDVFRIRYVPLALADDRQKRLAREERDVNTRQRIDGEPVQPAEVQAAPPTEEPSAPAPIMILPFKGGTAPKLTGEQAREIYQLVKSGASKRETARTYGVIWQVVHDIVQGKTYRWATEDLLRQDARPAAPVEAAPVVAIEPQAAEAPAVQEEAAPVPTHDAPPAPADRALLANLADALDFLLEYAGRPLPKFMLIDLGQIKRLAEQAREASA